MIQAHMYILEFRITLVTRVNCEEDNTYVTYTLSEKLISILKLDKMADWLVNTSVRAAHAW